MSDKNPKPTKEMVDFFETRTKKHISRVVKNMKKVAKVLEVPGLLERAKEHDASKFQEVERLPYIWLTEFHRLKNDGKTFEYPKGVKEKVDKATLHHIQTNRHHPESHESPKDMTDLDIIEMVCDWTAMSQELKQDDGSAKTWADKNVGSKWKFSKPQVDLIYKTIKILDEKTPSRIQEAVNLLF